MTQRIRRTRNFDITLNVKNDAFIAPPKPAQRNWLLSRAVAEMADDLDALHEQAGRFVPGAEQVGVQDRTQANLSDDDIMEDWQIPLMAALAELATRGGGDVLEIGFGRGVASDFIQAHDIRSHTIIECNDAIVERFHAWREQYSAADIRLQHGLWQDVLPDMGRFDSIFFHTYPLNEEEFISQISESVTFAEHFFGHAAAHLNPGGVFTYLSFEIDSLGRNHQRALLAHFSEITLSRLALHIPVNTRDAWWADSMVVVAARL